MIETQPDLREALAMVRALWVIDALPPAYKPSDDTPLRGSLPGVWPTIGDLRELVDQVSALQAEVERLQKVEGEREKGRVTSSPCWSDKPEPVPVSALRATITSRTLPAGTLQIYRGIATGTTGAFMAPADVALLIGEIDRLTHRLIEGPANPQECAEFCRVAREDGDGKPCLDCHPENFTF